MPVAMIQLANVAASEAASGMGAALRSGAGATQSAAGATAAAPFADLLTNAVSEENHLEDQARTAVAGLMTGSGIDVHQAMIATQKASMAFELSLAMRNKAVQAYQQVMSMQF
jgi:flagellar hook-basal body complex protein FliE